MWFCGKSTGRGIRACSSFSKRGGLLTTHLLVNWEVNQGSDSASLRRTQETLFLTDVFHHPKVILMYTHLKNCSSKAVILSQTDLWLCQSGLQVCILVALHVTKINFRCVIYEMGEVQYLLPKQVVARIQ